MKVCRCSPQRQNNQSYLFWLPRTSRPRPRPCWISYPGKSAAGGLSCSLPYYRHYSPPPTPPPTGWLLARAGYVSPCCKVMWLWYMCFCAEVFFLFSHCTPKWSIVWGLIFFFSPPSPHVMLYFSSIPCLPVLSTPLSYVCCVCMDRLMANFAGTCD